MFNFNKKRKINKVLNPLNITNESMVEFSAGFLANKGLFRFKKIIEFKVGNRTFSRYLLYSEVEEQEYVLEAFVGANDIVEAYLYKLYDTVPFSEDFLDVAGQLFFTTPDGYEYQRNVMPDNEDRIDGIWGLIKVYDIDSDQIEKSTKVRLWDYSRDIDGRDEYLNIEMGEDNGMFKIFIGELMEDIFYKLFQTSSEI